MGKIYVVKRRAGVEHSIPVWNLGGYIETPVVNNVDPKVADKLEALLEVETV